MARPAVSRRASRPRGRTRRSSRLARLGFHARGKGPASKGKGRRKGGRGLRDRLALLDPRGWRFSLSAGVLVPALAAAVVVALGMAALRIDLIRARYEIGMNYSEENRLNREIAQLTARMRELRDPGRLGRKADVLGFVPPQRVIDLAPQSDPASPWSAALRFVNRPAGGPDRP